MVAQVKLACFEDGLDNIGFRKFSAYVSSIHKNTKVAYIPTGNKISLLKTVMGNGAGELADKDIDVIARWLSSADIVGISSMTQYASFVHRIIRAIRKINSNAIIIYGGIHAIIHPEDAIEHADIVCTFR